MRSLACAIALVVSPSVLAAQAVQTGILPDTITVGDVARAVVRVTVPFGSVVQFPDSLTPPLEVENAGARVTTVDTTAAGLQHTAIYSIAAWRPGAHALPDVSVNVDGRVVNAALDSLRIQSVLPADTTGIQPKPLKAVMGGTRAWWPIILMVLAIIAIGALIWYVRRRRRLASTLPVAIPSRPARDVALERLERARAGGHVERGDYRQFYSEMTEALRDYAAATDPALSQDLTTSELAARMRRRGVNADAAELLTLLGSADLVKFARITPRMSDAYAEWTRARQWVESAVWPPSPRADAERAA